VSALSLAEELIHRHPRGVGGVLAGCAAAYLAMTFAVPLCVRGLYANDMNQNLAWAHRLGDPTLFSSAAAIAYEDYFYGRPGMRAIYGTLLHVADLELSAKLLSLALGAALLAIAYATGKHLGGGRRAAGAIGALALCMMFRPADLNIWAALHGGLPRSLGLALTMLGFSAAIAWRWWLFGVVLLAAGLVYPPAFALLSATGGARLLFEWRRAIAESRSSVLLLALFGVASAALVLALYGRAAPAEIGPPVTFTEALHMPALRPGGLAPLLVKDTPLGCILGTGFGFTPTLAVALATLGSASLLVRPRSDRLRDAGRAALALAVAGVLCHAAAYLFFFKLYHPMRYIAFSIPFAIWILAAQVALALSERVTISPLARARFTRNIGRGAAVAAVAFLAFCAFNLYRISPRGFDAGHTGLYRSPVTRAMCDAIERLPKDALIAAHPDGAGDVQFLCRRGVLVQADGLYPYRAKHFAAMHARMLAVTAALYATDWAPIQRLHERYGVDYFLVNHNSFRPDYSAWSDSYPELRVPDAGGKRFVLLEPAADRVVAADGDLVLVSLR